MLSYHWDSNTSEANTGATSTSSATTASYTIHANAVAGMAAFSDANAGTGKTVTFH